MGLNNDLLTDAYQVTIGASGQYVSGPDDLSTFTKAAPEPSPNDTYPQNTGWFRYKPSAAGTVAVALSGVLASNVAVNTGVRVTVYRFAGNTFNTPTLVADNDNSANPMAAANVTFASSANVVYYIRVSPSQSTATIVYLKVVGPQTSAPDADLIATAPEVDIASSGTWLSAPVPDDQLTVTSDEPIPAGSARSAWWQLAAAGNQSYVVTGSVFDAAGDPPNANLVMQIWYDNYGQLVLSDTKTVGQPSNVSLNGGSRHAYITIYNTVQSAPQWTYQLDVTGGATYGPRPPDQTNHQYVNSIEIPAGNSWSATLDTSPSHFGDTEVLPPGVTDVGNYRAGWYSFTPAASGSYTFSASGTYNAEIDLIMQSDGSLVNGTTYSSLTLRLTAGVAYWVRIATVNTSSANTFTLSMTYNVDTTNHQYTNAIHIPASGIWSTTLNTSPANFGVSETNPTTGTLSGSRAGWYIITPTVSANYTFNAQTDTYTSQVQLFDSSFTQLDAAGGFYTGGTASLYDHLTAGSAYYYRVFVYTGDPQVFTLSMMSDLDTTNHQYANAIVIPGNATAWSATLDQNPSHFGDTETMPPGVSLGNFRAGWYSFTPAATGAYVFAATGTYSTEIDIIRQSDGAVLNGGVVSSLTQQLSAGVAYWLRVATANYGGAQVYTVTMTAPSLAAPPIATGVHLAATGTPAALKAAPIALVVRVKGHLYGEYSEADAAPIAVDVAMASPSDEIDENAAPPIKVGVGIQALAVEAGIYLTQPEDGEVIATATPEFIVALDQHDDGLTYTIEIQYDETDDFSSPYTLSDDVDSSDGGLDVTALQALTGTTGFWRARLLLDGQELIGWTPSNSFTIDATVSAAGLPVTWTVNTSAARPIHLWHFDPPGPAVGDLVTAYGQGFPSSGNLSFADGPLPYESWQLIAADAAMSGEGRVIDGDVVDPEHYEVTFYAPEPGDEPGGAFVVEA